MAITIFSDLWQAIRDIINDNVTDPKGRAKWIFTGFPEYRIESKDNYPIIVIPPFSSSEEFFTMTKGKMTFTIDIEMYSTKAEELDDLTNKIFTAINENKWVILKNQGYLLLLNTGRSYTNGMKGGIKIHASTLTFECQWIYTRGS